MRVTKEPKWEFSEGGYKHLMLTDPKTGWGIELVPWPNDFSRFLAYIIIDGELYRGPIYDCPFDLAVELMETCYSNADNTEFYNGESMTIPLNIAGYIVRVMAPGRGLLFGV